MFNFISEAIKQRQESRQQAQAKPKKEKKEKPKKEKGKLNFNLFTKIYTNNINNIKGYLWNY